MTRYLLLLLVTSIGFSQEIFRDERFGFSMERPADWLQAKTGEAIENASERIQLPPEKLQELLRSHRGSIDVVAFYKYDLNSVKGVIPTIKILLRSNPTKSASDFKQMIGQSFSSLKKSFPDFTVTVPPTPVKIGEKTGIHMKGLNKLETKYGVEEVRTIIYAIPHGDLFYQLNFMDTSKDDCRALFTQILASIKI
ncbi:hypothetical protein [Flavobacterium selenitireducens]|uniref:hypothetical protein n=1 Tax=Flavobacterium selenitireducens TaxID=2722704 RepID=UPI00168A5B31|nr:hypothetical protein [Flavobacterium selenitireducens]MBD3582189.1 hypothetical protein [Flavobacterium selenitireducens]